jgi:hypothetical protein
MKFKGLMMTLGALVACGPEAPQGGMAGPPTSTPSLRETWRADEGRLLFETPGTQGRPWRRMPEDELSARGPGVKLGVYGPRDCLGWVSVTPGYDDSPRLAADAARAEVFLDALEVHVDEDVKYDRWTARRWEVQGRRGGVMTSIRTTFFVHLGSLYRLEAEGSGHDYGDRRRCLDQVTAGFIFNLPPSGLER